MRDWPDRDDWARLDAALNLLLDVDPAEQAMRIECDFADRPELAGHLRELLAHASGPGLLDRIESLAGDAAGSGAAFGINTPVSLGDWRLTERVGRGGMAEVWLGERTHDGVMQRAALKLMTAGLSDPELRRRFAREREILARLSDARIARYYDGGISAEGRPWLAMEYVDGEPIDRWCARHALGLRARVKLLSEVIAAVAHAHRTLIVHRDIKPSNVLVSAEGQVKLLDFGIAKQIAEEGGDGNATQTSARVLTLHYSSPEQLRGEPVSTATDVFLLGLLLFELICGERPFAGYENNRKALEHAICEIDPPRPSEILARRRKAGDDVPIAPREVSGDLDAIVQHALEKLPMRRYGSVDAFREDLLRWQQGSPIRARRIGAVRRCGKWLARHRVLSIAACIALIAGIAYSVTAHMQARAIQREASINRAVRNYLIDWFQAARPGSKSGGDLRASEMLADGLAKARRELSGEPGLQAEILSTIGEIYMARGEYAHAEPVLRDANDLYSALPELDARHRGANTTRLATLMHYTGRYAEAESMFRQALRQQIASLGSKAFSTLVTRQHLADLLHSRGRYADAIAEYARALADARATLGEAAGLTAALETGLADVDRDSGRLHEANALFHHALSTQRQLYGETSAITAATHLSLGRLLLVQGRIDQAAMQIEPGFRAFAPIKGATRPATAYWERYVAELEEMRGDLDGAAARLSRLTAEMRSQLPPGHLMFGYYTLDAGYVALAQGKLDEAQRQFEASRHIFDGIQPAGHPRRIEVWLGESLVARRRGDVPAARRLLAAARAQAQDQLAPGHPLFAALAAADGAPAKVHKPYGLAMLRVLRALNARTAVRQGPSD
ncbi:MAG: serine/threonine-protein kinase [Rudaea sp.]